MSEMIPHTIEFIGTITVLVPNDLPGEEQRKLAFAYARATAPEKSASDCSGRRSFEQNVPQRFVEDYKRMQIGEINVNFPDQESLRYKDK